MISRRNRLKEVKVNDAERNHRCSIRKRSKNDVMQPMIIKESGNRLIPVIPGGNDGNNDACVAERYSEVKE